MILLAGGDKGHNQKTFERPWPWLRNFSSKYLRSKPTKYDVAEYLRTPEEMAAYLEACLEEANGDAAFVARALGNIARAKGMTQVARDAGFSREVYTKPLSGERYTRIRYDIEGHHALGLKLHAEAQ